MVENAARYNQIIAFGSTASEWRQGFPLLHFVPFAEHATFVHCAFPCRHRIPAQQSN
jgi:hypothetical protein